jgi:hypothetical protein
MKYIFSIFHMPLALMEVKNYSLNGCYCKIPPDLPLGNYKTYYVRYFWVKLILGDHVLLILATNHMINFLSLYDFLVDLSRNQ